MRHGLGKPFTGTLASLSAITADGLDPRTWWYPNRRALTADQRVMADLAIAKLTKLGAKPNGKPYGQPLVGLCKHEIWRSLAESNRSLHRERVAS